MNTVETLTKGRWMPRGWPVTGLGLLLFLWLAPAWAQKTPPDKNNSPTQTISWHDCHIRSPGYPVSVAADCGQLEVPENRDQPTASARTIRLNIARIKSRSANPQKDPVLFLAGGPGQAAVETFPAMRSAWRHILKDRDVILVDQRGTGQSNPLQCAFDLPSPILDVALDEDGQAEQALRQCLKELEADPQHYTTGNAIEDLEDVRRALGIEQWNLLGVSYGTRKALTYLKYHPQAVRAVVLDSVVPQDEALGSTISQNLDQALKKQFAECARQTACKNAFGDSFATLWRLLQRYEKTPALVRLPDPLTGEYTDFRLDRNNLALAVRLFAYAPSTMALIPLLLDKAEKGQPENLAAQAVTVEKMLKDSIANGLELSVICSEDAPFYTEMADKPNHSKTVLGDAQLNTIKKSCALWPHWPVSADFKQPVYSDKPVLLLSGELDPITPPAFAEKAAQTLSHSQHIVAKGQGHNVFPHGCLPRLVARFFAQPDEKIEDECLQNFDSPAFFIDLMGPDE